MDAIDDRNRETRSPGCAQSAQPVQSAQVSGSLAQQRSRASYAGSFLCQSGSLCSPSVLVRVALGLQLRDRSSHANPDSPASACA
jgi:hypothetical protein